MVSPSLAFLFPCALIEDFTLAKISTSPTVETKNKWSTTSNTELVLSLDEQYRHDNRKSLKLTYNTTDRRYAIRGDDGVDYDHTSWDNPFASTDDNASLFDHLGMWIYAASHDYVDDSDLFNFGYYYGTSSSASSYWNASVGETGKWIWLDDSVTLSGGDVERFFVGVDKNAAGTIYLNGFVAFKRSTSNAVVGADSYGATSTTATGSFDWKNGLGFIATSIRDNTHSYSVSGYLHPKHYRKCKEQLKAMQTTNLVVDDILKSPVQKYSCISDTGYVKTYLFYTKFTGPGETANLEMIAQPVVIGDVSFDHRAGEPHIIPFSMTLHKFYGV